MLVPLFNWLSYKIGMQKKRVSFHFFMEEMWRKLRICGYLMICPKISIRTNFSILCREITNMRITLHLQYKCLNHGCDGKIVKNK